MYGSMRTVQKYAMTVILDDGTEFDLEHTKDIQQCHDFAFKCGQKGYVDGGPTDDRRTYYPPHRIQEVVIEKVEGDVHRIPRS